MAIKRYTHKRRVETKKTKNYKRRTETKKPSKPLGKKFKKFLVYLILILLIGLLGYFLFNKFLDYAYASESMVIKDIEVFGTKNVTKAEIKELLPFKAGDSLLEVDLSQAEEEIQKIKPELKKVSISRRWKKVKVRLYERTPEAFVKISGNSVLGIDFEDKPFPLRGFMSQMQIPTLICNTDEEKIELLNFLKDFKPVSKSFLENLSEIRFNSVGEIVFITDDKVTIVWGYNDVEQLRKKFNAFQEIFVDAKERYKKINYIDMTLYEIGRVVVKPA